MDTNDTRQTKADSPWMTLAEVAEYVKFSQKTIERAANEHDLIGGKVRGEWRFHRDNVDEWITRHQKNPLPNSPRR